MSHNKRCYVKKINKSAAQGSRRVDLMFKQASLKAFTLNYVKYENTLTCKMISWDSGGGGGGGIFFFFPICIIQKATILAPK